MLFSPCFVGQDWPLLPEGAQPPYGDHDSLQTAKVLYHPRPVGQDWPLLPEGAQPPYDDHNSLQDVKVSFHTALNTKLSQPSQGLKIVCFIRIADPESDIILSYKCQLQNVMAQFCNMQD